jgi:hypothetical protein
MDKNERLSRIKSLLDTKKKEEDVFSLKIKQINEELYAKQMNPLLINYLNFTSSTTEKIEKAIKKAGGKFVIRNAYQFTRADYEKGYSILEKDDYGVSDFFKIFGAEMVEKAEKDSLYEFLDQVEEIVKDLEFARKHSYLGSNLEQISFRKYLKIVYDDRIELLKKPLDHISSLKIHGIWEIVGEKSQFANEPSYLLAHCTRSHTSCWPIISEGLKISKSAGGRCGRGIYFSNDISKCLQYTTFTNLGQKITFSLLFFAQVYTGKIRKIYRDDGSLTKSNDYDTILATGQVSPKMDVDIWHSDGTSSKIFIDTPTSTGISSSFYNNEYVIYDEKRSRLRYVILVSRSGYGFD